MNNLLFTILYTLLYTTSYSQAQTDRYLILSATMDTFDLSKEYMRQAATIEYSIDESGNRFLTILKNKGESITHGPLEFAKQGKIFNTDVQDWKWTVNELGGDSQEITDVRLFVNENDITFVLNYNEPNPYILETVFLESEY